MKWKILNKTTDYTNKEVIEKLLENRGLKTEKEIEEFLNSKHPEKFTAQDLGIDQKEIEKALKRIKKAIEEDEGIIVYGDYDADGICATAILWETLYKLTKNVLPYIPERVNEGYGLNENSIKNLKLKIKNLGLIIAVDHGIVGNEKIKYAKELGVDVIVCDHHQPGKELPDCEAIVHTDKVCAAAIAWFVARELTTVDSRLKAVDGSYLDLVAIATIADLEPLLGINRSFVKDGLEALNQTNRPGLLSIFEEAGIKKREIGTYEVGFIIAPRLNAMGRMEHALDSLRLICTSKADQAKDLASKLGLTNKERQALTEETALHAKEILRGMEMQKLLFLGHETYNQGIIGLVAGRLVEEFYRPAIVLSIGEVYAKASARSISGFNIIEAIRSQTDLLVDAGGHPMAAGFTVETTKIEILKNKLLEVAEKLITPDILEKSLKVDLELPLSGISLSLWKEVQSLSPFGLGNPEPIFFCEAIIRDFRLVGSEGKHLKLTLIDGTLNKSFPNKFFSAIAFNQGKVAANLSLGQKVKVAYALSLNEWNNEKKVELKVKDINGN
ncbi:MAG: single-stranded-DNA-specific exonuclease RecJ [Patescibacteria group bacterium]|nr:single-stranded-DNA-specific exonuclease RecJ [Patescibacteria group bacterium]